MIRTRNPVFLSAVAALAFWAIAPALAVVNLHADTLEAAYWGQNFAFGYAKHPPVTTWILHGSLRLGLPPILAIMLVSQITVAIAAYYTWRICRLFGSLDTAACGVLLFLASPAATVFAVQANHNSMLVPFWICAAFYGLQFLQTRQWRDAIFLGVAAGLGMLTKYEMAFILVALVIIAIATPRYRSALLRPAGYAAVLICALILAPHVLWLSRHDWSSVHWALDADKVQGWTSFFLSLSNFLLGLVAVGGMAGLILMTTWRRRRPDLDSVSHMRTALMLGILPVAVLVAGSAATGQIIKSSWLLALTPTTAAALAIATAGMTRSQIPGQLAARRVPILSGVIFVGFVGYLLAAVALGKPLKAFSANTRGLATATADLWRKHNDRPLTCVVVAEHKLGLSGALWLPGRTRYLDLSRAVPERANDLSHCRDAGAVAILPREDATFAGLFAGCPSAPFDVPSFPNVHLTAAEMQLIYLPPAGEPALCAAWNGLRRP